MGTGTGTGTDKIFSIGTGNGKSIGFLEIRMTEYGLFLFNTYYVGVKNSQKCWYGYVTEYGKFSKWKYWYGIRTHTRTPESGLHLDANADS